MATATQPGTAPDASSAAVTHKRATVRPDKAQTVAELAEAFRGSAAAVLTEYRGLTVKQISELRVALGADTSYAVVKNTLTRLAARDAGVEGVEHLLKGPTAVAFISGEPVTAAKALREFARTNPVLVVKGGVMDGQALSPDDVRKLADLESREVLLAKMAGALLASLSNAASLFQAPLSQAARAVGALQAKAEQDPSVLAAGAGSPAGASAPQAGDPAEAGAPAEDSAPDAGTPVEDSAPDAGAPAEDSASEAAEDAPAPEPAGAEVPPAPEPVPATEADSAAPEGTAEEGITPAETDDATASLA